MTLWFGKPGALVALPDPDPGVRVTPERRAAEHRLLSGARVVDFAGTARRVLAAAWSRLTDDEHALLEEFHSGARGRGPWALMPDVRWNYLSAEQASATSLTLDAIGWTVTAPETLSSATTPVYRGPRSLAWTLPAAPASARLWALPPAGMPGWPCPPATPWVWSARARSSTASVFRTWMQLRWLDAAGTQVDVTTVENFISVGNWTTVSVTASPPAGAVYVQPGHVIDATTAPAFTVHVDTPMLALGSAVTSWLPGRGLPQVAFTDLTDAYPWADTHNTSAVFTEVG